MRINEIINEAILDEVTRPSLIQAQYILYNNGYKHIGEGLFARVYAKPQEPIVLKLFSNDDRGYLAFLRLAERNRDNIHFPVFRGKLITVTPEYSAVRMEKLSRISGREYDTIEIIKIYLNHIRNNVPIDKMTNSETIDEIYELFNNDVQLKEACDSLGYYARENGVYLDIHSGNIMKRGNILVFTDPYVK